MEYPTLILTCVLNHRNGLPIVESTEYQPLRPIRMQADREEDSSIKFGVEIVGDDDATKPSRRWLAHRHIAAHGKHGPIPLWDLEHERPVNLDRVW